MVLNPFSSLQPPDSGSEMIVQAKPVVLDEAVEKAYKKYTNLEPNTDPVSGLEKQILSPSQIDGLLQIIKLETEPKKLNNWITGLYLARLIEDSYCAGNNDFMLTTGYTHIIALGYHLRGADHRKLKLRINGSTGRDCGEQARYNDITVLGNVGEGSGLWASNTIFTTHTKQAYFMFKKYASIDYGNTIRLADSSGRIIKEEHL